MRLSHRKKLLAILLSILLLLSATSCSFLNLDGSSHFTELSDAKPLRPIDSELPKNEDCRYVSDYLVYWGMPSFQPSKLIAVEKFYEEYYIGKLPDLYTRAKTVYDLYRKSFADRAETNGQIAENVTAALIACYQDASGDKYAVYMDAQNFAAYNESFGANYVGSGVYVQHDAVRDQTTVLNVFKNSPAEESGVLIGDIILTVNGIPLSGNTYDQAFAQMKGEKGDRVVLVVLRGEETVMLPEFALREVESYSVSWRLLAQDQSIACIKIEEFNAKTAEQFKNAYDDAIKAGANKLIFDLRDNPGGEINAITEVLDYLLPDGGPIAHFRYKEGSDLAKENDTTFYADDGHKSDLPMVVLCNGSTASAGELFTAALRDYGVATVVGETTYGKGTMQNMIALPDGSAFTVSVARYDPPYGENYEGIGIIPHVSVELPEEIAVISPFLRNDEDDTQLQAAVRELGAPLI